MAWFRLEGRGAFHQKVLAAGNEPYGAWCRAGQWSVDQLTDGLIPSAVADQIAPPKIWGRLVAAGLVHVVDGGYKIHDFLEYNPPSDDERARRAEISEARRSAGKIGGKRSAQARASQANGKQTSSKTEASCLKQNEALGSDVLKQNPTSDPDPDPDPDQIQPDPCVPAAGDFPARVVTGTHTSGLRGPGPDPSKDQPTAPTPKSQLVDEPMVLGVFTSADELQAELGLYPTLAPLANDLRYAEELLGTLIARGVSRAAVRRCCQEFQIKNAFDARSKPPSELARLLGGYFIGAKSRAASMAVEATDQDAQALLALFDELWREAHDGQPRGSDIGDEHQAAELVVLCRNAGSKVGFEARDVFRHVAKQYFADDRAFIRDELHPLRLLAKRFSSYELPTRRAPLNGAKRESHGLPADPKTVSENVRKFREHLSAPKADRRKIRRGDYGGEP